MRGYNDLNQQRGSKEGTQEGGGFCWQDQERTKKGRDEASDGKQKLLKRRVYHESSKSLWASGVGAIQDRSLATSWLRTSNNRSDCLVGDAGMDSKVGDTDDTS